MKQLFCDCKTDEEKANFFLSGRAVETGTIALAISNDVAMAYHRCAEFQKETDNLSAKITEMEKQEPIGWLFNGDFYEVRQMNLYKDNEPLHGQTALYARPGAKGEKMFAWLKRIFDRSADPVHSCDLYHDKEAGSCVHVDGPLCNFPECSMLADYQQQKEKRND